MNQIYSPASPQPFDGIISVMSTPKRVFECVGIRFSNLPLDNLVALCSKLFLRLRVAHCDSCVSHFIVVSTRKLRYEGGEQDCAWERVTTFDGRHHDYTSRYFGHVMRQTSSQCQTGNTSPRLLCPMSTLPSTIHQAAQDVDLHSCSPTRRHALPVSSRVRFHSLMDFAANFARHTSKGTTS